MSSDNVRTVAVPLTQEQYDDALDRTEQALRRLGWGYEPAINQYAERLVTAVLSASPEVLAAAMGGRYAPTVNMALHGTGWDPRPVIVLPSREVSRGE